MAMGSGPILWPHRHASKIRTRIYQLVLHQSPDKYATKKIYGSNLDVQNLFALSKWVYRDAMPFFFSTKHFRFSNVVRLGNFLDSIGPHARQHITKGFFVLEGVGAGVAIGLLASCPNLQHLSFSIRSSYNIALEKSSLMDTAGCTELLEIRGLKTLNIEIMNRCGSRRMLNDYESFRKALQVLKKPYSTAAIIRRAARGITPNALPRTHFGAVPQLMTMAEWRVWAKWLLRGSPETEYLLAWPAYHAVEGPETEREKSGCGKGVSNHSAPFAV